MRTLLAITLATALATPANAASNYPADHTCKQWLRNYGTGSNLTAGLEALSWMHGVIEGVRMGGHGKVEPLFGDPVVYVNSYCKRYPEHTLGDAITSYVNYAIQQNARARK
jgi:hypothetical protein